MSIHVYGVQITLLVSIIGLLGVVAPAAGQTPNFELKKRQLETWAAGRQARDGNWWLNIAPDFLDMTACGRPEPDDDCN